MRGGYAHLGLLRVPLSFLGADKETIRFLYFHMVVLRLTRGYSRLGENMRFLLRASRVAEARSKSFVADLPTR
jgi:hypothetical protein